MSPLVSVVGACLRGLSERVPPLASGIEVWVLGSVSGVSPLVSIVGARLRDHSLASLRGSQALRFNSGGWRWTASLAAFRYGFGVCLGITFVIFALLGDTLSRVRLRRHVSASLSRACLRGLSEWRLC